MKVKHLDDLYSWRQIRKLCHIHDANLHHGFVPVAFIAPGAAHHSRHVRSSDREDYFQWYGKSSAHYAKTLWDAVRAELRHEEETALAFDIVPASECFNTIRFRDAAAAASYVRRFWDLLREFANSGRFKAVVGKPPVKDALLSSGKLLQEFVFFDDGEYQPYTSHRPIPQFQAVGSLGWDKVQKYYVELTESELAFLNGEDFINREPSEIDKKLFQACDKLDIAAIKEALAAGANPNAFSDRKWGSVVGDRLYAALEYPVTDVQFNLVCEAVKILVDGGYDLDLSPYGEGTPLWTAGHTSARCVRFLLDMGATPNAVCWISSTDGDMGTALDHVSWDIAAYGPEPDLIEMQQILDARGGKFFSELVPDFHGTDGMG